MADTLTTVKLLINDGSQINARRLLYQTLLVL